MNEQLLHQKKSIFRRFGLFALALSTSLLIYGLVIEQESLVQAETADYGGYNERFKGGGDKIPPECQLDLPTASLSPFFVKWNCSDDNAMPQDIKTELWIYRKDAPAGALLASFLGFPASVQIDEHVLGVTNFKEGLPVAFRLRAVDRAGITMVTPLLSVTAQDKSLDTCSLHIVTEQTASTGDTTGLPSQSVIVEDAAVAVQEISETEIRIITPSSVTASTCEIESICSDGDKVLFEASLALASGNTTSGTLIVTPGNFTPAVTGTTTEDGVTLSGVSVTGDATVNGANATFTLNCAQ